MTEAVSRTDYRPQIEGLRALAAALVAVCHVWQYGVSGGVDVFFVVSGFLVTTSLVSQHQRTGGLNPFRFWVNLLNRLMPTAYLVSAATVVAALVILPSMLWVDTIRNAVASLFYFENWRLAFDAVNYLKQDLQTSPFRHYWALAVQSQFYLVWPLLMLVALRGCDGTAGRRALTALGIHPGFRIT